MGDYRSKWEPRELDSDSKLDEFMRENEAGLIVFHLGLRHGTGIFQALQGVEQDAFQQQLGWAVGKVDLKEHADIAKQHKIPADKQSLWRFQKGKFKEEYTGPVKQKKILKYMMRLRRKSE